MSASWSNAERATHGFELELLLLGHAACMLGSDIADVGFGNVVHEGHHHASAIEVTWVSFVGER